MWEAWKADDENKGKRGTRKADQRYHYTKVQRDVLQDAVDVMSKVLRKAEGNGTA